MSTPASLGHPAAAALLALLLALAGCGEDSGRATDPEETASVTPEESNSPSGDQQGPVDEAVADLAERLDVPAQEIEVLEAEAITWRDSSLGCPKPGELYTQALVEGHRVILRAGKRSYSYHSGGGRGPFLCENLQPSIPPEPGASD